MSKIFFALITAFITSACWAEVRHDCYRSDGQYITFQKHDDGKWEIRIGYGSVGEGGDYIFEDAQYINNAEGMVFKGFGCTEDPDLWFEIDVNSDFKGRLAYGRMHVGPFEYETKINGCFN